MGEANLTDDEVKEALRILKPNKSPGYDNTTGKISGKLKNCKGVPNL